MPIKKLPQKLQVEDVLEGECYIATVLLEFMSNLIQGPSWQRQNSDHDVRLQSLCSDINYMVTNGRVRPS